MEYGVPISKREDYSWLHWGRGPMEMGVYMLGTFQALSQSSSNVPTRYISFTFEMLLVITSQANVEVTFQM